MKKFDLKKEWRALSLILATALLSVFSYPYLPNTVASHWDFYGNVNGWMSRSLNCWLFPLILLALYISFWIFPLLDPKKERYAEFAGAYRLMRDAILFVLFGVFVIATLANLGVAINVGKSVAALLGLLMMVMGNYFGKIKRNWFMGFRSPWTMSSENVWNKTHRFGGRLFIFWGIVIFFAPWMSATWGLGVILGGAILIVGSINIYSYLLFKKEAKK